MLVTEQTTRCVPTLEYARGECPDKPAMLETRCAAHWGDGRAKGAEKGERIETTMPTD